MSEKYDYKITELCRSEIEDAMEYISSTLHNPDAAESLLLKLQKEIDYICKFPYIRPDCQYYYIDDRNIRHSIVGNYVMIYRIDTQKNEIRILRFVYGKMDFTEIDLE